jgi:hypothetical protein
MKISGNSMGGGKQLQTPTVHRTVHATALLCAAWLGVAGPARATERDGWHHVIEPYIMFPNMKGKVGFGNYTEGEIDQDPGDIFSHLEIGAMFYAEAHNDTWALSSDVLYMKLSDARPPDGRPISGTVEVAQVGWELAALRRVSPWLELGVAAVYNEIDVELDFSLTIGGATTAFGGRRKEIWIDPAVVARATHQFNDKWFVRGRGNIGGLPGVGSTLMWQAQVDIGYRFSSRSYMTAGYRVIDYDYRHGDGQGVTNSDYFRYDMRTFGPQLRFGFRF